jgi:uncharacterized cupredoxin-like copper-binding protein
MRLSSWFAIGTAIAVVITGCTNASAAAKTGMNVTATEFKLAGDTSRLAAGSATFTISNRGVLAHEFVIIRSDLAADSLPKDDAGDVAEGAGLDAVDEVEDIAPGSSKTLVVDLKPGKYVFICNVPGHYMGGMHGTFEVVDS